MFRRNAFGSALWLAILLTAGGTSMRAPAAEIAIGHAQAGTPYIGIVGDIESGDDRKFIALATQMESGPVILASEGGSVVAAIKIGEAIRLKGYPTFVPEKIPCNSACALIWLAGSPRMLSPSTRIGFHAGSVTTSGAERESGAANAIIGRYLTLLGLSERAILFATLAPPNKLNFLDAGTLAASGIDAEIIDAATNGNPADEAATASPPTPHPAPDTASAVMETSVLKRVGFWRIAVDHTLDNSCFAIGDWSSGTSLRIGINLRRQGRIFVMVGNPRWASLIGDNAYPLRIQIDGSRSWDVDMTVIALSAEEKYLFTDADDMGPGFWDSLFVAERIDIFYAGARVDSLNTPGLSNLLSEIERCQQSQPERSHPFVRK
jgi:hypothetical protein